VTRWRLGGTVSRAESTESDGGLLRELARLKNLTKSPASRNGTGMHKGLSVRANDCKGFTAATTRGNRVAITSSWELCLASQCRKSCFKLPSCHPEECGDGVQQELPELGDRPLRVQWAQRSLLPRLADGSGQQCLFP
jgi:hypothetical protein